MIPLLHCQSRNLQSGLEHAYHRVPPCSINSTPFLTTPTTPPVCTTSPPPPLSLCSTSAKPSNQVTLVCGGTSSFASSSPSAVRISAKASPLLVLRVLMVVRQVVMSGVERRVSRMVWMSSGCGEAMHS